MATENRHHSYEAEEIRVDITTGEPVFVNGKFNPVPFKFKAEHKAGYADMFITVVAYIMNFAM